MSTVQISPSSALMNSSDVNPLAYPSYQQPIQKIKELNNKAFDEIKTDTVTISQNAITRFLELNASEMASDKNTTGDIKATSLSSQWQVPERTDISITDSSRSYIDQVSISAEASLKSSLNAFLIKALSELSINNESASALEIIELQ